MAFYTALQTIAELAGWAMLRLNSGTNGNTEVVLLVFATAT
jgi:hypothetical protein